MIIQRRDTYPAKRSTELLIAAVHCTAAFYASVSQPFGLQVPVEETFSSPGQNKN